MFTVLFWLGVALASLWLGTRSPWLYRPAHCLPWSLVSSWKPWKPLESRAYPWPLPATHPEMPADAYAWDAWDEGRLAAWSTPLLLQTVGGQQFFGHHIHTRGPPTADLADAAYRHWLARGGPPSLFASAELLPDLWPRCHVVRRQWTLPTQRMFFDRYWMRVTRARAAVHSMLVNQLEVSPDDTRRLVDSPAWQEADRDFVDAFRSRHRSVDWLGEDRDLQWWREPSGRTLIGAVDGEWVYFESEEEDRDHLRAVMLSWIERRAWQHRTWIHWHARLVGHTWPKMQDAFADWQPLDRHEYWYALNWDVPRLAEDRLHLLGVAP